MQGRGPKPSTAQPRNQVPPALSAVAGPAVVLVVQGGEAPALAAVEHGGGVVARCPVLVHGRFHIRPRIVVLGRRGAGALTAVDDDHEPHGAPCYASSDLT